MTRDLSWRNFGDWTVLEKGERRSIGGTISKPRWATTWLCLCRCGVKREIMTRDLTTGKSKSCGCHISPKVAAHNQNVYNRRMKYQQPWKTNQKDQPK